MNYSTCSSCGATHAWSWPEAFDKFGFADGDGLVMTEAVASALRQHGYRIETTRWGLHNTIITSIKRGTPPRECIPSTATVGYDDPRDYLPKTIIDILDDAFPEDAEVAP